MQLDEWFLTQQTPAHSPHAIGEQMWTVTVMIPAGEMVEYKYFIGEAHPETRNPNANLPKSLKPNT